MGMPRIIVRSIAALTFALASLTGINTSAMAADADRSASVVEQERSNAPEARTKEERLVASRTKEE